jgi:hypothetical protein
MRQRWLMGYSTAVLFVEGAVEDIAGKKRILGSFTGELVSLDTALSKLLRQQFAIAQLGPWVVIVDPGRQLFDESFARSPNQRALWISLNSVVSSFGFIYRIGGKVVRQVFYKDNRPTLEIGQPLAEEAGTQLPSWGHDEAWGFTMVKRLTGIRWVDLEPVRYAVMQPGASVPPVLQTIVMALARAPADESTAKDAIFHAFADASPDVREAALRLVISLRELTEADLERIAEMAEGPDERVARWADIALRNIRLPGQ